MLHLLPRNFASSLSCVRAVRASASMAHIRTAQAVPDVGRRDRVVGGVAEARSSDREVAVATMAFAERGLMTAMREAGKSDSAESCSAAER